MPIYTALVGALHVEYLKQRDLGSEEHPHHTLFQTSTIRSSPYAANVSKSSLGGS
jgi:hypothetical protein